MEKILRLLPLIVLIGLVDLSFYTVLLSSETTVVYRLIVNIVFITIPIMAVGTLFFFPKTSSRAIVEPVRRDAHASILIIYLSKFLGLVVFAVFSLVFGTFLGLIEMTNLSVVDLSLGFGYLRIFAIALSFLLSLTLLWGMYFNRYRYKVHQIEVPIEGLSKALEGFTLVQLSDIHAGSFTKPEYLRKGIEKINAMNPDLVCFTGDLVNNVAEEIAPYIQEFKNIKSSFGVYAILGNHDYGDYVRWGSGQAKSQNLENLLRAYENLGWQLLRDEAKEIFVGNAIISLLGVENISAKGRFKNYGDLSQAYRLSAASDLKILLSHDPSHWREEVLQYPDINLCLSGHTHGMQFGIEIGKFWKWSPVQYVYKEWAGLYQAGKQYLYVNRGFGFLGYPGRIGILPEITQIRFTSVPDNRKD